MLEKLTNAFGVSGAENDVRDIIKNEMKKICDTVETDSMGNLICFKKGTQGNHNSIMLTSHMDEVGFIVSGITKDGYLRFKTVGGIDARVIISKRVIVGSNRISGVIGAKPTHLQDGKGGNATKVKDLLIDIGANNEDDAKTKVKIGDYISFDSEYVEFGNDLIKAKALDDRIGCNILIQLANERYSNDVYYVFTVQEEVGCRGASVASYSVKPKIAIVVEGTTCSDVPGTDDHSFSTKLRGGAALSILDRGSYSDKNLVKALYDTAKKNTINVQYKQTTLGGNDAAAIHLSREGIRTAVISVPCRYIHSPSSVACKDDINSCYNILYNFLKETEEEVWNF